MYISQRSRKGMRMEKSGKAILILLSFLFVLLGSIYCPTAKAQDESAYIVATIDSEIPSIRPGRWFVINITVIDKNGFNWTYFSQEFLNYPILRWYGKILVWVIWPKVMFRDVADFFGYNTLFFYPEIVEGDPRGWKMKVIPSSVSPTTDEMVHHIKLYVWADKTAMDYSVTVGIRCTRYSYNGRNLGTSYIYVPVKLQKYSYVEMVVDQPRISLSPWSTTSVTATVTNKGYYEDTLHFILKSEGDIYAVAKEQQLVIKPGESRKVTFVVRAPRGFLEYGKLYEVKIYATSVLNPNQTCLGSFMVMVEGISSNPYAGGIFVIPIITIPLFVAVMVRALSFKIRKKIKMVRIPKENKIKHFFGIRKETREIPPRGNNLSRNELTKLKLIKKLRKEEEKQRRRYKV